MPRKNKPYSEYTEADWERYFRLKQFKGWHPDKKEEHMKALVEGESAKGAIEGYKIRNLEESLPPELRSSFRKDVKTILTSIKTDVDSALIKPLVEEYVYSGIVLRIDLISRTSDKPAPWSKPDSRSLQELIRARLSFAEALGQTLKERRLAGKKSESSVADLVGRASEKAREAKERAEQADPMIQKFEEKALPSAEPTVTQDVEADLT